MDFMTACGSSGPLTLDIEGPGYPTPRRWVSPAPYVLIGRDDRADLVLDDEAVSRRHAYLQLIDGRLFFVDLDSRTGTIADAVAGAVESGWLAPGQALHLGPYAVRLVPVGAGAGAGAEAYDPATGAPVVPPNPLLARSKDVESQSGLPRVTLEFQGRTSGHSVWRMSQRMALVGSSSRCRVRLIDSNVSKLHCALIRTPGGLWVVDLLGRNGITLNGVPARAGRLGPADVLGLGQMTIRATFEGGSPQDREADVAPSWATFEFGGAAAPPPGAGLPQRPAARPWTPPAAGPMAPPAFPAAPGHAGLPAEMSASDPALALLLNHFGQMQQQMLDQFQQSMMMMLQMFSGMHRDQMGLVREELDRLRELNNEISSIKHELAHRQAPADPRGRNGRPEPSSAASAHGPFPMPPPPPPPRSRPQAGPNTPPSPTAAPSPTGPTPDPEPAAPPPLEPTRDVHEWLNDRLTAITVEQQNRWQRVMNLLRSGK